MKTRTLAPGLLILLLFVFSNTMAQKAIVTSNSGLSIGFGGGMSYQKSDLLNSKGFGFDFTLGSQIYQKENAFLSVDWKFRFLAGQNKSYDHRINPDDTYSNIRYSFFTYDLELGLTLNRLRERTGIVLSGFAGVGITHGRTFTDLYDAGNNLYDYSSIDPNQDSKSIYEDLVSLSDGDFETHLVNKAAFLPSAGLFLGYQFSRSLTIGIEYKTNFYLTEENGFAGIDLDNRAYSGSGIDRNNYVSIGFRWKLRGNSSKGSPSSMMSSSGSTTSNYSSGNSSPVATLSSPIPIVRISDPGSDPYHTESPNHTIRATIENVSDPNGVSFYQNGYPNNNFTYNVNTRAFTANIRLREGENGFRISASNPTSSAEDEVTIILSSPPEAVNFLPSTEFTSPWRSQISSTTERLEVTAGVRNISSKEGIQLTQNGWEIPFEFDPANGLVSTFVSLTEGENHLLIEGSNESGSDQDRLLVYFGSTEAMAEPTVQFTNPIVSREVNNRQFPLRAKTQHVYGRNDIGLSINGASINNFSFSDNGEVYVNLVLSDGINTIEIIAENEAGFARDRTSLTFLEPVFYTPVYNEPVTSEPVYNEPVRREPVQTEPVRREPVQSEPVRREPVNGEAARRDPARYDPVQRENVRRDPVRNDPVRYDPVRNDPVPNHPVPNDPVPDDPGKEEKDPCGVRINPGNSDWEFCLVCPSGTYTRENLGNKSFTYSGSASSLFFKPIGGGGDAIVNGKPYALRSGQYYLFTGRLKVSVSTNNPGSMGHWSVCITTDRAPVSGNGNNRPKSPCESEKTNGNKGKGNKN